MSPVSLHSCPRCRRCTAEVRHGGDKHLPARSHRRVACDLLCKTIKPPGQVCGFHTAVARKDGVKRICTFGAYTAEGKVRSCESASSSPATTRKNTSKRRSNPRCGKPGRQTRSSSSTTDRRMAPPGCVFFIDPGRIGPARRKRVVKRLETVPLGLGGCANAGLLRDQCGDCGRVEAAAEHCADRHVRAGADAYRVLKQLAVLSRGFVRVAPWLDRGTST